MSFKKHFKGAEWGHWPEELRDRKENAVKEYKNLRTYTAGEISAIHILQQWYALKTYCDSINIKIFGDIPIYVNYDSADVWSHPDIFSLNSEKRPLFVSGVPPDYFSATGQLWGHPVYKWDLLKKSGYAWWIKRIEHNLKLFHLFRLDHFRGLSDTGKCLQAKKQQ
jgi:4-alpha-glucanotransferase